MEFWVRLAVDNEGQYTEPEPDRGETFKSLRDYLYNGGEDGTFDIDGVTAKVSAVEWIEPDEATTVLMYKYKRTG